MIDTAELRRLRRVAREAQRTYVGRHWPSMESMRRDGIGYGLVEDQAHERFILRYLDTFQPDFVLDLLDRLAAERARVRLLMAQASSDNLEDGRTCLPTRVAAEIVEPG